MIAAHDPVVVVTRDVVRERQAEHPWTVGEDDAVRMLLHDRVVIDRDVARASNQEERIPVASPILLVDIGQHVVANRDVARLLTGVIVLEPENRKPAACMLEQVVFEYDVLDLTPRAAAVLVANREEDADARLPARPVELNDVVTDRDPARVFQFDQVLDGPPLIPPA